MCLFPDYKSIFPLAILFIYITYLDHLYPHLPSLTIHGPLTSPSQLHVHHQCLLLFSPPSSPLSSTPTLCFCNPLSVIIAAHMLTGETPSTGAWVTLHGPHPLKKTDSPSHSSHHLPITPQLAMGFHETLPHICWHFSWLDFV